MSGIESGTVSGRSVKLNNGGKVFVARSDEDEYFIGLTNAQGDQTRFRLTAEAAGVLSDLIERHGRLKIARDGWYDVPDHTWALAGERTT